MDRGEAKFCALVLTLESGRARAGAWDLALSLCCSAGPSPVLEMEAGRGGHLRGSSDQCTHPCQLETEESILEMTEGHLATSGNQGG